MKFRKLRWGKFSNLLSDCRMSSCSDMYASTLATKTASMSSSSSMSAIDVNTSAEALCRHNRTLSRTAVMYEHFMMTVNRLQVTIYVSTRWTWDFARLSPVFLGQISIKLLRNYSLKKKTKRKINRHKLHVKLGLQHNNNNNNNCSKSIWHLKSLLATTLMGKKYEPTKTKVLCCVVWENCLVLFFESAEQPHIVYTKKNILKA